MQVNEIDIIKRGDIFLLCTDGFWEHVTEQAMLTSLENTLSIKGWLEDMVKKYIQVNSLSELRRESFINRDNYTALAVWVN
ncbi:MAG: hypothetical protein WAS34_19590 [Thiolinea sp.]